MEGKQSAARKEKYLTAVETNWFDSLGDKSAIAFAKPGYFLDSMVAEMMEDKPVPFLKRLFSWNKLKRIKRYSSNMEAAWEVFIWITSGKFRQRRNFFKAITNITGGNLTWPEILVEYRGDMAGLICRAALIAHLNGKEHKSQELNKEDFYG